MSDALDTARRALAKARGEALVTVARERSATLRFASSRPTQATSIDDLTVEIAVVRGGHVGRATTNRVGDDALADCGRAAALAAEAAADSAGEGHYRGFPEPAPVRAHDGFDAKTAALDPATGADGLRCAFGAESTGAVRLSGIWTAGDVETAIASSTGIELSDRVTDAFMKVIATAPNGRTGYAAQSAVAASGLDPAALAERAADTAAVDGEPVSLPPGDYTVVMEPHAVLDVLWVLGETAFDGLAHAEGRGALSGKLGTRVVSPSINLSDSPRFHATLPRAFDAEGVPKAPLPLIQDGVAHRVVHDTRSAAIAGPPTATTGHALVAGGQAAGPRPTNLVLIGGGAADESELCAPVERGIYVTRLWYTNVLRPTESRFTAVTRDGTFLIEDGRIARPLEDMRLTDSALAILSHVQALGARSVLTSDGELYGRRFATGSVCPPLRTDGVHFSGSARHG
ncbi:MAG TPA: TldD/PmbA family protein [Thermoleophilaceae bacterium]|nr:TldD/PmbA family protein [Thermoleophilaceae bacterium]